MMSQCDLWFLASVICLVWPVASPAADIFDFQGGGPQAAKLHGTKLLLVDREVMIGGPSGPGKPGFVVSSCSSRTGPVRIWFERDDAKLRVLVVDDSKEVPVVTFQESNASVRDLTNHHHDPETVQWTWAPVGKPIGDSVSARLCVRTGKFKDWHLAADGTEQEIKLPDSRGHLIAYRLKLENDPPKAIQFSIFHVAK